MTAQVLPRPVRAAVISAGAWSQSSHLPTLKAHPGVDLVALSSPNEATARKLAAAFDVPLALTDWREILAQKPDIVVVSSPPVAHEEQVVAALESGAHVLVEKPFALEAGAANRMRDRAARVGRTLLVGFGWPAAPGFSLAKALIDKGEVGQIEHLTMHLAVNTRALLLGGADGGWAEAPDAMPNERMRPLVLRQQLAGVAAMTRGEAHSLATLREALEMQEIVEAILASG